MSKKTKQSGFTLIEVMVATLVFSLVIIATSTLFSQVLTNQRRAAALQKVEENGQYIMELLAREIRVSDIVDQNSATCSLTSVTVTHPVNGIITYQLVSGVLQRVVGGVTTDLSSPDVEFNRFNFCVLGSGPTDDQSPRVTIVMSIQNKIGKYKEKVDLQTTVVSRDIESEF